MQVAVLNIMTETSSSLRPLSAKISALAIPETLFPSTTYHYQSVPVSVCANPERLGKSMSGHVIVLDRSHMDSYDPSFKRRLHIMEFEIGVCLQGVANSLTGCIVTWRPDLGYSATFIQPWEATNHTCLLCNLPASIPKCTTRFEKILDGARIVEMDRNERRAVRRRFGVPTRGERCGHSSQ